MHAEGKALVEVGASDGLVLERREVTVDAKGRAERWVERRAIGHQDSIEEGFQGTVWLAFDLVENMGRVHGTIGGAGQTGCQSRALVREVSGICGGTGRGKVRGHVRCLLWEEGPRVQLKAACHQVGGRLRKTLEHREGLRSVSIDDLE